jgi:hypothetical protein
MTAANILHNFGKVRVIPLRTNRPPAPEHERLPGNRARLADDDCRPEPKLRPLQ